MSEWKETKLQEFCTITSSKRIFSKEYVNEGIPFLRSKEIIEKALGESVTENLYISTKRFKEIKEQYGSPQKGDILLSSVGVRSGISYLVKEKDGDFYFKDGNLIWLKDFKSNLHSKYLMYWLNSYIGQDSLSSIMIGSAQPALTIVGVSNLFIKLPPLEEQKRIADVLSCLDAKIENLRQQNNTLEQIAQTLFKHWFIDFEFPNTDDKPYKSSGGEMQSSVLGDIPKGWRVGLSGEFAQLQGGFAFKSKDFQEEGKHGVIKIRNISDNIVDINKTDFISDAVSSKIHSKFKLLSGDILIAMTGAEVAKIGVVPKTKKSIFLNQRVGVFREKICGGKLYIYYLFSREEYQKLLRDKGSGSSAQPNISSSDIESIEVIIPLLDTVKRFEKISSSLFSKKCENLYQIQTLTKIRDTLLPKLMSGQIRIEE